MTRLDAIRRLVSLLGHEPVLSNLGTNTYDLFAAGDRPENFYSWGAMGTISSVGLGLALARPDLRVVALDGDGSLLMNLGSLATIASLRPSNLVLLVCDNRAYETTGGQPTATSDVTHLAAVGRGAGLSHVEEVAEPQPFEAAVRRALVEPGPWLIVAHVTSTGSTSKVPRRPIFNKDRFMDAIGVRPARG